jgi:hypothetical protein
MKLNDTSEMMNSKDFKERFRAEYFQLVNRIEELSTMLDDYRKGTLKFEPKCTLKLLDGQMRSMITYKTHLEERAKLEEVNLEEPIISKIENPDQINTKNKEV